MGQKRILIVGDANSFLLNDIVLNLTKNSKNFQIDILNTNPTQAILDSTLYSNILKPNSFHFFFQKITSRINPHPAFYFMRFLIKAVLRNIDREYDIVHIHFFNKNFFYIDTSYFQRISNKLIITFWGSDFYKRTNLQKIKMIPYLNYADEIIFANPQMKNSFLDFFKNYETKIKILPFGLDIFNSIDNLIHNPEISKSSIKNELGYGNKTVISIGYSSHPEQHQVEILESIAKNLSHDTLNNLLIILPLTYGDKDYSKKIISTAKNLRLNYIALTSKLSKDTIAKVRYASDIMIHLRNTDQFSGSFQEYLYARNIVITGTWLPYKFLIDDSIFFHSIDDLDKLFPLLSDILMNLSVEFDKTINNPKMLAKYSHWDNLIEKHISSYN